jgi:hypothetical protein
MRFAPLLIACLAGCSPSARAPWPASGVYSGYYRGGYEVSEFIPSGSNEKWWFNGVVPCLTHFAGPRARYIAVRGTLSAEGKHGHLGAYSRELKPQEFLECRELSPNERPDF